MLQVPEPPRGRSELEKQTVGTTAPSAVNALSPMRVLNATTCPGAQRFCESLRFWGNFTDFGLRNSSCRLRDSCLCQRRTGRAAYSAIRAGPRYVSDTLTGSTGSARVNGSGQDPPPRRGLVAVRAFDRDGHRRKVV